MVAAPHTSNWDFVLTMAMAWATRVDPVWLGKKEMFAGPTGRLFRLMGGVPVDREDPRGLVDAMVELARTRGSKAHDEILPGPDGVVRASGRSGGTEGGMSTGEVLRVRAEDDFDLFVHRACSG